MKNLELKQQLAFCQKYRIAPNELLLLQIILLTQEGEEPELAKEYFYLDVCSRGKISDMLIKLQETGIINKSFKLPELGSSIDPNDIPLNKNVIKDYYKCSFDMGKELFEIYPQFGMINGQPTGIRSVSKKFNSLEDFYCFYGKTIGWNPNKHNSIIELVNWGKDNNVIVCTLCNFVIDHKWEELEALRNGDLANVNFDAVKLV